MINLINFILLFSNISFQSATISLPQEEQFLIDAKRFTQANYDYLLNKMGQSYNEQFPASMNFATSDLIFEYYRSNSQT